MKKTNVIVLAMVFAMAFASAAFAKNGLSVGVGFGVKFDANELGSTVQVDGLDKSGTTSSAIIPENTLNVMKKAGLISDLEDNGTMSAIDFAVNVRYDILNFLFFRTGFNYNNAFIGGETSWKYTAAAAAVAAGAGGTLTAGAEHKQEWGYWAWAVPVQIGINIPIQEGKYNIYAGVGVTVAGGEWTMKVTAPTSAYILHTTDNNGAIEEELTFKYTGVGFNYVIGADAEVVSNVSVFLEVESQFVAGMSDVATVQSADAQTVLGNASVGGRIAYTVIPGGTIYRVGAKYHFGLASI